MKGKKLWLFVLIVPALLFLSSCGGDSAGGGFTPTGATPGVPESIQLLPSLFVAATNGCITLNAQVLDGNGVPVANVPVLFTNLSAPFGMIYNSCDPPDRIAVTSAITDINGFARVILSSTTEGFDTVVAQMNIGGLPRTEKTMFFTSAITSTFTPTLTLDIDAGEGTFSDVPADYTLFKTPNDTTRAIRATVTNGIFLVQGSNVTFAADQPYKLGSAATCSDGSTACAVSFPDASQTGDVKTTNSAGQASTTVVVAPAALSSVQSVLNITATASNGAFNLVSLFLKPVTVSSVTVSGPSTVAASTPTTPTTATYTAAATTTVGTPVPDGTTVNFTASDGGITPFAQTTSGAAQATYTAPVVTSSTPVTITASVNGVKSAPFAVTVTPAAAALTITPSSGGGSCSAPVASLFVVTGGVPPYNAVSSTPSQVAITGGSNIPSGGTFTATPAGTCNVAASTPFAIVVTDSVGNVASLTYTLGL